MQRIWKRICMLLVFVITLTSLLCFTGCKEDTHVEMDVGTYLFEKRSYKNFVTVSTGEGTKEFSTPQTSAYASISTTPKKYVWKYDYLLGSKEEIHLVDYYFEDCFLEYEITVNGQTTTKRFYLGSNGEVSDHAEFFFAAAYKVKKSYKLVDAGGYVVADYYDGYTFEKNGVDYTVRGDECSFDLKETKSKIVKIPELIAGESRTFKVVSGSVGYVNANKTIEGIVFDGTFDFKTMSILLRDAKDMLPNLKVFAVKGLNDVDAFINGSVNLPAGGVSLYLGDYTAELATEIKNKVYFIREVLPYSQLPAEYL